MTTAHDPPVWWLAAPNPHDLVAALDTHAADTARDTSVTAGSGPARLGIVEPNDRKLRLARRLMGKAKPWRGRSDIWFTPEGLATQGGQVVLMFPGVEPSFEAGEIDLDVLGDRVGLAVPPISDDSIAHRSASIYRLGIFCFQVLQHLGARADMVAGHSIGEWSATVAAGSLPLDKAEELLGVVALDTVELPDLDFGALGAGVDNVAPVISQFDDIVITHDNCPRQSVICGPPEHLGEALQQLREAGVLGYRLSFQSGFHTPAVKELVEQIRPALDVLPFGPPRLPLWSATTISTYPEGHEEIVDLHLRHLVEPVRFRPLVERLYQEAGARIFIQAGLGSLPGFVTDTLGERDHAAIELVSPKRSALAQTHRALTALWVEGLPVRSLATPDDTRVEERAPAEVAPDQPAAPQPIPAVQSGGPLAIAELLLSAAQASTAVLTALETRLGLVGAPAPATALPTTAASAPTNVPVPTAGPAPSAAAVPAPAATLQGPVTFTRRLSLENMPETLDHTLMDQPEGWPDPSDLFPIVAMTTQLELLQDIGTEHAGDGRQVTALTDVRAMRWLEVSDPQDVKFSLSPRRDDESVIAASLGQHCRADLHLDPFPPATSRTGLAPLENPRAPQHTAREMFDHRLMFHGPRFQGVTVLGPIGDNGMSGELRQLDTPGSLLDDLGKLIAYWVMDQRGLGEGALPIRVDRIQWFGPLPPAGTNVHCEVRILELQSDGVRADGALVLPSGMVLCKVDGWTSIVFHRDELMEPLYYNPRHKYLTEPQPGGWEVALERWPSGAGRELTARRFMVRQERQALEDMNLLQQRRRVLELVAAKDTVRRWLWETYQTPSFPAEILVTPDGDRRYRVSSPLIPDGHDLRVTVSLVEWAAGAVLGDGEYRDIELELVPDDRDPAAVAHSAANAVESRNPGNQVDQVGPVTGMTSSSLEVVAAQRPFAAAWTPASVLVR